MVEQEIIIGNIFGIHARPAALIAQMSNTFAADIRLEKEGKSANAKSIMNVMMLEAVCKSKVIIRAQGADEKQAVEALAALFASKFDEK